MPLFGQGATAGPLARLRALLNDPVYRRERRHAGYGRGYVGRGLRAIFVAVCYAAFISVGLAAGDQWVEWLSVAGHAVILAVFAVVGYAAPALVGSAVAYEMEGRTLESLCLTPLSRNHIVFAKLFGRMMGLVELVVAMLPLFLLTPRSHLMDSLIGMPLSELERIHPPLRDAAIEAAPYSFLGILFGLRDWLTVLTGVYVSTAAGLAGGLLARSSKLAVAMAYVGLMAVSSLLGLVQALVWAADTALVVYLSFLGHKLLAVAIDFYVWLSIMTLFLSIVAPTAILLFFARRIDDYLDTAG